MAGFGEKAVFCKFCQNKNRAARAFAQAAFCLRYLSGGGGINYYMKLLEQILGELGADTLKAFTVVPDFGGYFRSVKSVAEYSEEKIVLLARRRVITIEGKKLEVGKYFEQDIFIKGEIEGVKIEK